MSQTTTVIAKPWYHSKTYWINGLVGLAGLLAIIVENVTLPPDVLQWIIVAQAAIAMVLRKFTTHPVSATSGQLREIPVDPAAKP